MALLVIVGLLTGAIVAMVIFKVTRWWELLVLGGWGVLATVAIYNGYLSEFVDTATAWTK